MLKRPMDRICLLLLNKKRELWEFIRSGRDEIHNVSHIQRHELIENNNLRGCRRERKVGG